jgi:hypothetical protein
VALTFPHPAQHFVAAAGWLHKAVIALQQLLQLRLVLAESEEVVLLLAVLAGPPAAGRCNRRDGEKDRKKA